MMNNRGTELTSEGLGTKTRYKRKKGPQVCEVMYLLNSAMSPFPPL